MSAHLPIPVQAPSAAFASQLEAISAQPAPDRFDLLFGRMRGTMTIVGDIVNPDPEMWTCERD